MARIFESPAVIIALIVLVIVLFGAKRLPDVAKSVGSSMKIFKKEVKDLRDDEKDGTAPTQRGGDAPAESSTSQASTTSTATPQAGPQDPADGTRPNSTGSTSS